MATGDRGCATGCAGSASHAVRATGSCSCPCSCFCCASPLPALSAAGEAFCALAIKGDATVGCVEVQQVADHATTGIVVERGPVSGTNCGMSGGPRCEPTMVWRNEAVGLSGDAAKIPLGCGEPNMQYFGELLIGPSLAVAGHFGHGSVWSAAEGPGIPFFRTSYGEFHQES